MTGAELRTLRESNALTQRDLAALLGMSRRYLQGLEARDHLPTRDELAVRGLVSTGAFSFTPAAPSAARQDAKDPTP